MVSPELLRRYPFFGGLKDDELAGIAMIAEEVAYADGAVIFREGEMARCIYVLVAGTVDLVYEIQHPDGVITSYIGAIPAGEPFGISAFVEPYRLTATAKADGAVRAIAIDAAGLRALSEVDCHLGYAVMRQVARALAERLGFARVQLAACGD
jgi:CRP/FNR family transcriptional regulator, cyclic AMP receptor protein